MIDKATFYQKDDGYVLEFPDLETISLGDPDIQRQLIKWGLAVGIPGGEFCVTKNVKLIAGKNLS